ncbi:hypothetical protein DPMN_117139 [Dreissena polymorpha]|uniref:Uncharacterized protein n=1 Tax=Dreissena polymorpha TaxID=45954 RepID=A0A9D4QU12_DREPO|nr:hypothetical protein DPMN_117139 [Dreissena polymorpha]
MKEGEGYRFGSKVTTWTKRLPHASVTWSAADVKELLRNRKAEEIPGGCQKRF